MTGNLEIGKLGIKLPSLNPKDGWTTIDQNKKILSQKKT